MKSLLLVSALLVVSVLASPVAHNEVVNTEETLMTKLNTKCSQRDTSSCLMLKLVTYMNRLLKKSSIGIGDSLVITQTTSVLEETPVSRSLQDGDEESQMSQLVADKLWDFVRSRYVVVVS